VVSAPKGANRDSILGYADRGRHCVHNGRYRRDSDRKGGARRRRFHAHRPPSRRFLGGSRSGHLCPVRVWGDQGGGSQGVGASDPGVPLRYHPSQGDRLPHPRPDAGHRLCDGPRRFQPARRRPRVDRRRRGDRLTSPSDEGRTVWRFAVAGSDQTPGRSPSRSSATTARPAARSRRPSGRPRISPRKRSGPSTRSTRRPSSSLKGSPRASTPPGSPSTPSLAASERTSAATSTPWSPGGSVPSSPSLASLPPSVP